MLWAWIDLSFRSACSRLSGTRLGGGQGRPRGATSPLTVRVSKGRFGVTPAGKGHAVISGQDTYRSLLYIPPALLRRGQTRMPRDDRYGHPFRR
jgi:hypothetical protein